MFMDYRFDDVFLTCTKCGIHIMVLTDQFLEDAIQAAEEHDSKHPTNQPRRKKK